MKNIRYPQIPNGTPEMQIKFLKKALYSLIDELNMILPNLVEKDKTAQNQSIKK